jgi:hypothetical protein
MSMPIRLTNALFIVLFGLTTLAPPIWGQGSTARQQRLATRLNSPNSLSRAKAFEELSENDLRSTAVRTALQGLLSRENQVVDSINARGQGTSEAMGEGFSEYIADVINACFKHCNRADPKVISALATSLYAHDSELARALARENGPQVTAIMLDRVTSPSNMVRRKAVLMLGTLYAEGKGLTGEQKTRIHSLAQGGVNDRDVVYQIAAISVLGRVGNRDDLTALRNVGRRDFATTAGNSGPRFPVRDAVDSAIARIERRHLK